METKICPTCKIQKDILFFSKNKSRKDGLSRQCKECFKKEYNIHYHTKKSPRLKENLKKDHKVCSNCKKELPLDIFKPGIGRFGVGPNCRTCFNIKWNQYQKKTHQNRNYNKNKKQTDPQFKIKYILRLRLLDALKRHNKNKKITKNHSALTLLGCSVDFLKKHLENQFLSEMTWDNHGKIWEIDHVVPCSQFDLTNIEQQQECFNYTNLQPLFKTNSIAENFGYKNIVGNRNKYNK